MFITVIEKYISKIEKYFVAGVNIIEKKIVLGNIMDKLTSDQQQKILKLDIRPGNLLVKIVSSG